MKKIVLIVTLIPFISFAQPVFTNHSSLPLIKSICSDTIKGSFKEIVFSYDRFNRVSIIVNRTVHLQQSNDSKTKRWFADTTAIQTFAYTDQQKAPLLRRTITYESSGKGKRSHWDKTEIQYFKYENGKRVRDSVLEERNAGKGKPVWKETYITAYEQTDSTVTQVTDFSSKDGSDYYQEDLKLHQNVIAEENAYHLRAHAGWTKNYTYTKFDNKINPFSQLNIAPILINEKINFSFEEKELVNLNDGNVFEAGGSDFNWHFINQNNPLHSTIKRGDTESPFRDISSLQYKYDQNKLPVYCTIYLKKVVSGGYFVNGYLKHFTFRYKK
jgi:hypothetical protein